jgi:hypothetical protein
MLLQVMPFTRNIGDYLVLLDQSNELAEFGLRGVVIYAGVQTPRACGAPGEPSYEPSRPCFLQGFRDRTVCDGVGVLGADRDTLVGSASRGDFPRASEEGAARRIEP